MSDKMDGGWHIHCFCAKCDHRVTWHQKMCSDGCCPYCGWVINGTVLDTVDRAMRWIPLPRKWWQVWRVFKGTYSADPSSCPKPAPNRRAAVAHTKAKA